MTHEFNEPERPWLGLPRLAPPDFSHTTRIPTSANEADQSAPPPVPMTPLPMPPAVAARAPRPASFTSQLPQQQPYRDVVHVEPVEVERPRASRRDVAQYVCLLLGLIWAVTGGIAVARLSIDGTLVTVAGMGFTAICGWGAITIGVIIGLIGAFSSADRGVLLAAATLLLAPGLVIAAVPGAFAGSLGATSSNGVAMCFSAAVLIGMAELQRSVAVRR